MPNQLKSHSDHLTVQPGAFLISQGKFTSEGQIAMAKRWLRAGARRHQFYKAGEVKVLVAVTGNISPALNNVIRELAVVYNQGYGISEVYGVHGGLHGIEKPWVKITPELVRDLPQRGGCILKTSKNRKRLDVTKVASILEREKITHLILIGGKGSISDAALMQEHFAYAKKKVSVALIGKFP